MEILIIALVLLVPLLALVLMYNSLIGKRNQAENAFASIDAILKKRYDLIPNLVAAVKQYMKHEAGTLTALTELRAKATSGRLSSDEKVDLNNRLGQALGNIMVAVENYPDLKASENFQQLQRSLNEVEEQLSAARRSFNASVTDLNNAVEMFPTSLVARLSGIGRQRLFEVTAAERTAPDVSSLFGH